MTAPVPPLPNTTPPASTNTPILTASRSPNIAPSAPRPGSTRAPLVVAVGALAVAVVAVGVALVAIAQAATAVRRADAAQSAVTATTAAGPVANNPNQPRPTQPVSTPTPAPTPLDVLNPQASFRQLYADQVLNLQTSSSYLNVDLDEPRVASIDQKADIYVRSNGVTPAFSFDNEVAAAQTEGTTLQPKDCAELIRTSPLPRSSLVPTQRNVVLCIATSATAARAQGIKQRMVILRVTDLNSTGKVTVSVSAWEVPDS